MPDSVKTYTPRPLPVKDGNVRIVVCISGGGTTLANLLSKIRGGTLPGIEIVLVISDRPGVKGLEIAAANGIPAQVVTRKDPHMSRHIFEHVRAAQADLVILGGFLSLIFVPDDYEDRVLNIHPSLIPAFCGRGFYGHAVHQAAIDAGVKFSGCTVHFADRTYDTGPIILQKVVPVQDEDTAETLASRVFEAETEAYPEAIRLVAGGKLERQGRRMISKK